MIPYVVIGIVALIGLAGWGMRGALVGLAIAWSGSLIIGLVAWLTDRGIVPRKARAVSAKRFLLENHAVAQLAYPGISEDALQRRIETDIETVFRASVRQAPLELTGTEYDLVSAAAQRLYLSESDPARRTLITALSRHILSNMYPQA